MSGDADSSTPRPILGAGGEFAQEGQRPPSFGEKFHPFTFEQAAKRLRPQVDTMRKAAAELPDRLRGQRVIIEATLMPNYLASSYHPEDLRKQADLVLVGTRAARGTLRQKKKGDKENQPTKSLLLAATDQSFAALTRFLAGQADDDVAGDLRQFESLALPGRDRVVRRRRRGAASDDPDDMLVWEAVLNPAVDVEGRVSRDELARTLQKWQTLVEGLGGEVHQSYRREVGDLTFMPVRLRRGAVNEVARFNPLRMIRPMPRLRRLPEQRLRGVNVGGNIAPPSGGPPAAHRIVTFDGGVDGAHPLLAPFVTEGDLTTAPRHDDYIAHGTLVTSALLYGHLQGGRALEPPPAHVDHFRLLPAPADVDPDDEPYWALDQIVATLRANPRRWKIANLSYGPDEPVDDDDDVNRFTAELDILAHELGLTVTVAAGNEGQPTVSTLGDDRVMAPADGVNVVGVGACDDLHPPSPVRAEYSCVGPGRPGLRVQPLGVAFGGGAGQFFVGAEPGGGLQAMRGTSFAAPLTARGLATLLQPIPSFSANLGRGFAAHFAQAPDDRDLVQLGYGRFQDEYGPLLDCGEGSVTVVVQDSIDRGETKAYALPYPSAGVQGFASLRWTLSFTSPTDPQDAVEYTLAGLECIFRPNSAQRTMNPPKGVGGKAEKVDLRTDGQTIERLARAGYKMGVPRPRSGKWIKSEQTLRDEGKWETLMRYEDRVRAPTLYQPELWITYYERFEGQLVPTKVETSLNFALVMTVESAKTADLYERVRADARFRVLAPIVTAIKAPV